MSDKIKEVLQKPEVPEELRPENIPSLIERNKIKQTSGKNTKNIAKYISALAACAVIAVGAVNIIPNMQNKHEFTAMEQEEQNSKNSADNSEKSDAAEENNDKSENTVEIAENLYFVHPESYEDIYKHLVHNTAPNKNNGISDFLNGLFGGGYKYDDEYITNDVEMAVDGDAMYKGDAAGAVQGVAPDGIVGEEENAYAPTADSSENAGDEVYETLQQVEGIAEADIIKANSECIYFIPGSGSSYYAYGNSSVLVSVGINPDGTFGDKQVIKLSDSDDKTVSANTMYLSGDKLILIASCTNYKTDREYSYYGGDTEVLVYDISDAEPKLGETYCQSGSYSDSRMIDDILYLTTNQSNYCGNIYNSKDYEKYIPTNGATIEDMKCIDEDFIYMPRDWEENIRRLSYVNIAGLDINSMSEPVSIASIAGYSGNMYCSMNNIYIAQTSYKGNKQKTDITRFSIDKGNIAAKSSGSVNGSVLNQFSMDEYDGYFRIATTSTGDVYYDVDEGDGWVASYGSGRSNNVFVLDMDMNTVGKITGIARTESIKSVTFQGKIGYVVTYQQTDPLYAIDFSNPKEPVILDEFKIEGYSSFLRKWNDDLLLGFGVDANENAIEVGVKLVMFDVSDNGDLKECGFASIRGDYYHAVYSEAVYDRKALLLSSQRNIIGFPTTANNDGTINAYHLFKYEDGKFKEIGNVTSESGYGFIRAVYAGDYIYMFTLNSAVSADIKTMTVKDEIEFDIKPEHEPYYNYYDIVE